jgi:hypothetical protein
MWEIITHYSQKCMQIRAKAEEIKQHDLAEDAVRAVGKVQDMRS